jgi:LPPG:FO 2-phospho-L-lactate transferase
MNDAIQGPNSAYSNHLVVLLAGGVGGARAARSLRTRLGPEELTIVGNVGDDDLMYGVPVSADLDTLVYTLADVEGSEGWGIRADTATIMNHLAALGVDTTFRLGDRDLATCLLRAKTLGAGRTLSEATAAIRAAFGVDTPVLPATDDPLRTRIQTTDGDWLGFQEYFVERGHRDEVAAIDYSGAASARPAPGVVASIDGADVVVIAPSNPPLSIHPILAVNEIERALRRHPRVVGISPLFGGRALKGPADRVLASLGYPPGNAGVVAAYDGILSDIIIDRGDAADVAHLPRTLTVHVTDTRLTAADAARHFGRWFEETIL